MQFNVFKLNQYGMYTFYLKELYEYFLFIPSCIHMNELK